VGYDKVPYSLLSLEPLKVCFFRIQCSVPRGLRPIGNAEGVDIASAPLVALSDDMVH